MRFTALLPLPLLLVERIYASAAPAALHFQHRFRPFPSSGDAPEWRPLGSASVDSVMDTARLGQYSGDVVSSVGGAAARDNGKGWYQVGVERDGEWVMASTRACLMVSSPPSLVLHLTDSHLSSISLQTAQARCTNDSVTSSTVQLPSSQALWDIQVQRPVRIGSPSNSAPAPPADPTTGLPKPPPVEKSFVQKWWLPMLGLALFAVGQFASPSEAQPAKA